MRFLVLLPVFCLILLACEGEQTSSNEKAPAVSQTDSTSARPERDGAVRRSPTGKPIPETNLGKVELQVGERTVTFGDFDPNRCLLTVREELVTLRLQERETLRSVMVGFRGVDPDELLGPHEVRGFTGTTDETVNVALIKCATDDPRDHVTMDSGTLTVEALDYKTGACRLSFQGQGSPIGPGSASLTVSGEVDVTFERTDDQRGK